MAIKDMLKKYFNRRDESKKAFKEEQSARRITRTLDEREKTPDERELERYLQEERQKLIKQHRDLYRRQRSKLFFKSDSMKQKQILSQPSMFVGKGNML